MDAKVERSRFALIKNWTAHKAINRKFNTVSPGLHLWVVRATLLVVMIMYAVPANRRLSTSRSKPSLSACWSTTESTTARTSVARLNAPPIRAIVTGEVTRAQLRDDLGFMLNAQMSGKSTRSEFRSTANTITRIFAGSPNQWRKSDRRAKRIRG